MIFEWLAARLTPTPPWARRLGFADELVAIEARAARCAAAWAPHRARCKETVKSFVQERPRGGRLVALGAGLADDLPLDALIAHFDEVVLADLVFSRRLRARRDLQRWTVDLLGLGPQLEGLRPGDPLPAPPVALPGLQPDDTLLSVNLLSQLADRPAGHLVDRGWPEDAVAAWAAAVIRAHLALLAPHAALLITDTERQQVGPQGALLLREDLLWGVDPGPPAATWTWEIAPRPEASPHHDERRLVAAWAFAGRRGPP